MTTFGVTTDCDVYAVHIRVDDVDKRAEEMIKTISDTSWISKLNAITKAAFEATSSRTIEKLVDNVNNRVVGDSITEDFGEYMVSDTAQCALESLLKHSKVPLAELIKARITGNEGFDFHTECKKSLITFGEAKYSGTKSPYAKALRQILEFIDLKKDNAELIVLMHHVSESAAAKCVKGEKAYAAAFSINADKPMTIINHALTSDHSAKLMEHKSLYLIGVEVDDPKLD